MNADHAIDKPFGKIRSLLWPIHLYELKKFLPMFLMFFFISFNYSVMRNIKDALVMGAAQLPDKAGILPFIKFWGVTPVAILFMLIYSKLSNILDKKALFYTVIIFFIGFFSLFSLVLYPNQHFLHADSLTIAFLPSGFTEFIRLWSFSLFYIFSELWGSIALSLLFWQFANQTTKIGESKRFYTLFGIGANLALVAAGQAIGYFSKVAKQQSMLPETSIKFSLDNLSLLFVLSCFAIMGLYWWINRHVLTDARFYDPSLLKEKAKKLKMGLLDSVKMLFGSKYLLCIVSLVICYGISINLIEVTWKNYANQLYPIQADYLAFAGKVSGYTGWATIAMMLFVSGNVLRKFGWTVAAQVTPVVLLLFGIGFFNLVIFEESFRPLLDGFGINILALAVFFGTIQNVVSKASKYSLFDPTKEMAYIPLGEEAKVKGKAAIDVVGARLGKSGGSIIQQALLAFGSIGIMLPYIQVIFIAIMFVWIASAARLGRFFNQATQRSSSH